MELLPSVYLPTNTSSTDSHLEYTECLDILHDMISKYRQSHKLIIAGDFNGTLFHPRLYNRHDRLLQGFVEEHELLFGKSDRHTFFHHAGTSSSQINYIFTTDIGLLKHFQVGDKDSLNSSSHLHIYGQLSAYMQLRNVSHQRASKKSVRHCQWNKLDKEQYQFLLQNELGSLDSKLKTNEQRLENLTNMLHKAAKQSMPFKTIHLKGPTWKESPEVNTKWENR